MTRHPCRICGTDYETPAELEQHSFEIHGEAVCRLCEARFAEKKELVRHHAELHPAVGPERFTR
jgi:predicted HNH restriction endonuclease